MLRPNVNDIQPWLIGAAVCIVLLLAAQYAIRHLPYESVAGWPLKQPHLCVRCSSSLSWDDEQRAWYCAACREGWTTGSTRAQR